MNRSSETMRGGRRGVVAAVGVLLVALFLTGGTCQTKKPDSDSTPPTIRWAVFNFATGQTTDLGPAGGSVGSSPGQSFRVTCVVEDPQGVHRITLGNGGQYGCVSGGIGQTKQLLGVTDEQVLNPSSSGTVLTQIFLIKTTDPDGWTCPPGFTYTSGSMAFSCTGENYFGGTTSSQVTVTRP